MPDTLDIEKIKRKYKPSYADYGKAFLANTFSTLINELPFRNELPFSSEDLERISKRAIKNYGSSYNQTPLKMYIGVQEQIFGTNEIVRLYNLQFKLLTDKIEKVATNISNITLITSLFSNVQPKNFKSVIDSLIHDLNEISDDLPGGIAYSYIGVCVWNTFIRSLQNQLGYRSSKFIYNTDTLLENINIQCERLKKHTIENEGFKNLCENPQETLPKIEQTIKYILAINNYQPSQDTLQLLQDVVNGILEEPALRLTANIEMLLITTAVDELEIFGEKYMESEHE